MRFIFFILICAFLLFSSAYQGENNSTYVKEESSWGPIQGDDNYIFGRIADISVDEFGNIYMLDSLRSRIQKFDSKGQFLATIGKPKFSYKSRKEYKKDFYKRKEEIRSIKPDELYFPQKFHYRYNKLYILSVYKVCIYSIHNEFISSLNLQDKGTQAYSILVNNNDEIIIAGMKDDSDKMFHAFSEAGKYLNSFGEYFDHPSKKSLPEHVDPRFASLPVRCSYSINCDKIYAFSPFQYEIHIFKGKVFDKAIKLETKNLGFSMGGTVNYIKDQFAGYSKGLIGYPPTMFKKNGYFFVCRRSSDKKSLNAYFFDVFKDNVFIDSHLLTLKGMPSFMNYERRLICIDHKDNQVTIYSLHLQND